MVFIASFAHGGVLPLLKPFILHHGQYCHARFSCQQDTHKTSQLLCKNIQTGLLVWCSSSRTGRGWRYQGVFFWPLGLWRMASWWTSWEYYRVLPLYSVQRSPPSLKKVKIRVVFFQQCSHIENKAWVEYEIQELDPDWSCIPSRGPKRDHTDMFVLLLWVSCIPASRTTAPPCGVNIPPAYLRLVHIIVFEKPVVGGLESQFLFSSIKAREDQERPSAMFHHVQSVLNVYSTRGSESQCESLKLELFYRERAGLFLTCPDLDLRGEKLLEGGEDATVWNNHRCMNLHFLLTFPHFHTCHTAQKSSSQSVTCGTSYPQLIRSQLESLLTVSGPLFVNHDLGDGSSDQAVSSIFLDGADDVEGDLTGASFRVVRPSFVVVNQQGIDENTGFLWWHTWIHTQPSLRICLWHSAKHRVWFVASVYYFSWCRHLHKWFLT